MLRRGVWEGCDERYEGVGERGLGKRCGVLEGVMLRGGPTHLFYPFYRSIFT